MLTGHDAVYKLCLKQGWDSKCDCGRRHGLQLFKANGYQ